MSSRLLKFSLYSSILNLAFTPFSANVARIFGYIAVILFLASAIAASFYGRKLILHKTVLYMLLAILVAFIVSLPTLKISSANDVVDKVISVMSFVSFYILLSIAHDDKCSFSLEDVFHINYILCAIFIAFAFGPFDFKYTAANAYGDKLFTMGLGNPNGTALCVMFSIVILMIQFEGLKKISTKIINLSTIISMFSVLFLLASRTTLACALIVAMAFLLRDFKFFRGLSHFILLVPFLMIAFQLALIGAEQGSIEILGKAINSGRPEMYVEVLKDILSSPIKILFGDLSKNVFYNYHNGILTILSSIGLFGVVLTVIFWGKLLRSLRSVCSEKTQKIAFVAVLALIIHSSTESMGVIGTIPYGTLVIVIVKIAKGEIISRHDRLTKN